MRSLTHSAISSASPIDSGMVPSANHRLLTQRLPEDRVFDHRPS
jgi:hypothetical protein